jgi:exopolysaccharide biosynthesis protein
MSNLVEQIENISELEFLDEVSSNVFSAVALPSNVDYSFLKEHSTGFVIVNSDIFVIEVIEGTVFVKDYEHISSISFPKNLVVCNPTIVDVSSVSANVYSQYCFNLLVKDGYDKGTDFDNWVVIHNSCIYEFVVNTDNDSIELITSGTISETK